MDKSNASSEAAAWLAGSQWENNALMIFDGIEHLPLYPEYIPITWGGERPAKQHVAFGAAKTIQTKTIEMICLCCVCYKTLTCLLTFHCP
jgi:hypothetical protein